jgi:hypothetical protein
MYLTVDSNAMRIWSHNKQIKALHKKNDMRLIFAKYIDTLDCFLMIYSKNETNTSPDGGNIELWNTSLVKLSSVSNIIDLSDCNF